MTRFYSSGKLLISGEYAVLDGALALAVPTKAGQSLEVETRDGEGITWTAIDHLGTLWFKAHLQFSEDTIALSQEESRVPEAGQLQQILQQAHNLNPDFLSEEKAYNITTRLEFPQTWGLGSSSTLINNIAQWFGIDAYRLLENSFGGSGYDIAAAQHNNPITFQKNEQGNSVLVSSFDPVFKESLFFVYLNQKQNSREAIAHYRSQPKDMIQDSITRISSLTQGFVACTSLEEFKLLMEIHETLISNLINTPKVKTSLFPDFPGAIKSLGGWGGDFVLATGGAAEKDYFRKKGYDTVVSYEEMVK